MENIVPKVLMTPLYHLELVKDRDLPYDGTAKTTEQAAQVLHQLSDRSPTEIMMALWLNSSAEIIGCERVGMGNLESVATDPTEIFRGALVKAAPEILLSHNHPNGDVHPSTQDLTMTLNTINLAGLLGLRIRDHIVVGPNGTHFSIRENFHLLHKEVKEAEEKLYGAPLEGLKDKILEAITKLTGGKDPLDLLDTPSPKRGGDPKSNLRSDWEQSLSWMVLNHRSVA